MLEYGIKSITTNPTLITKAKEVIRLVDTRSHCTRAFVIPAIYEEELKAFLKKLEFEKWVETKKAALGKDTDRDNPPKELMETGWENIEEYLDD